MLYTEDVERIIESALATPYVVGEENSRPVNIMLVCPSGGGGSALLLERYGQLEGVQAFGDITYMRLADTFLDRVHDGKDKTWIFAEFNKILGRKASVSKNTVGLMDEVCEEGCPNITLPYFERNWNPPVKCNVILKLTPSFFDLHALDWWSFGFLQRFIVVSWTYTKDQIETILLYIKNQRHLKEGIWSADFKPTKIHVDRKYMDFIEDNFTHKICEDMTDCIANLSKEYRYHFDRKLGKELPFRMQMRLQKLFKGLVLRNGHTDATRDDWLDFKDGFRHMNSRIEALS